MLVFCPDYTQKSHLAPTYLSELNALCRRDYGRDYFASSIICLDLDGYETQQSGNNDATMDAAMGIADWVHNHNSRERHLLIELRLDYKSTRNFDLSNMKRKVSHSRDILNPEFVDDNAVFLFETYVASKAKHYFSRLAKQDPVVKTWVVMDVDGFNNYIFNCASLPYEPENNLNKIEEDLKNKFKNGSIDAISGLVKYWVDQMQLYNLRYKQAESNAIASVILSFLQSLSFPQGSIESDYLALIIEDVKPFVQDFS
jgi:hypothetical protein